jgi:voltage-gated potassium channel
MEPAHAIDARSTRRQRLHDIIFEADTPGGKAFDVALLLAIVFSVVAVMLESVESIDAEYHTALVVAEWSFTIVFTIEYLTRLWVVRRPLLYARSFFGIVDLLSILPTFVSLFFGGAQSLLVVRALRLVRVFRIFKLARYVGEAGALQQALAASRAKITVFLVSVMTLVLIIGAVMNLVEGPTNPDFASIPDAVYWAIVTMTTVGYGDIAPITIAGKAIASVVMILGYGIIAVPTGIVSAELVRTKTVSTQVCPNCTAEGHNVGAKHCSHCGHEL